MIILREYPQDGRIQNLWRYLREMDKLGLGFLGLMQFHGGVGWNRWLCMLGLLWNVC